MWGVEVVLTWEEVLCKTVVTLARVAEASCSLALLTLMASWVAFICNLEGGTGQEPCQGICWLLHLLSPGSWGFWSPLALVQTHHFTTRGHKTWWRSKRPCPARSWVAKCSEFLGEGGYGVSGDRTEPRTGCWAGDKGALLHSCLQEVTLTPLSLCSGCRHEGEGKSREALCRSLRGPGSLPEGGGWFHRGWGALHAGGGRGRSPLEGGEASQAGPVQAKPGERPQH